MKFLSKGNNYGYGYTRRMYRGTINSYSRVERMNKFNTEKQTEETTEYQTAELMNASNKEKAEEVIMPETEYGFFLAKRG